MRRASEQSHQALRQIVAAIPFEAPNHPKKPARSVQGVATWQRLVSNAYESAKRKPEHYRIQRKNSGRIPGRPPDQCRPRTPLAKALLDARMAAGITQENLAASLGLRQSFVARLETDNHPPYLTLGILIAMATKTPLDPLDILARALAGGPEVAAPDGYEAIRVSEFISFARAIHDDPLDLFASLLAKDANDEATVAMRNAWLKRTTVN